MVRIQRRVSRKRYLNSKRVYEYERISLNIPREFHETVKPHLDQDFDMKVTAEKDSLFVTLTPSKTFRRAANAPTKTAETSSEQT